MSHSLDTVETSGSPSSPPPLFQMPASANELQKAFALFNQVSAELTQAYEGLQGRVASLTEELAVANGELRRQYEEKQALSERLGLLLNALPAGVVVQDSGGCVTHQNPVAEAMLGRNLVGLPWAEISSVLEGTDSPDEYWLPGPEGVCRVSLAEQSLESGAERVLLLHDITSAHELKTQLERNHRLAAMGEMAASLAHQLRTPLSTALLYASNLGKPDLQPEARGRFAEKTTEQLKRLERLIRDVLLFARGESIGREKIPVMEMVAELCATIGPLCKNKGVELRVSGSVGQAVTMGDRKALTGAMTNLLENALHVCDAGGRVDLMLDRAQGYGRIRVRDTGPGVAPETQARIFEPFYTTKGQQGTGLGLAIALGVARAHGGTIELNSDVGQGAEFAFILPMAELGELELQQGDCAGSSPDFD